VRLVQIRAELEAAIEVALGAHLQDVVVETWQDAEAAIALLKRANGGRATFLPLDTIRAGRAGSAPRGEGVLGMANQLVQFDPRYATIFDHLLGQTVIVTNLKVAHRLLGELRGNLRIVTLEGELVLASGAVSGGSRQATDGKIALEREWQEMQNVEAVLVAQQRELDGNLRQSEQAIAAADAELRALRIEQERQRQAGARLAQEAQHARDEIVYQQSTMQRAESELATFDQRRDELTQKERAARDEQAALASQLAELERQIGTLDSDALRQEISAAARSGSRCSQP